MNRHKHRHILRREENVTRVIDVNERRWCLQRRNFPVVNNVGYRTRKKCSAFLIHKISCSWCFYEFILVCSLHCFTLHLLQFKAFLLMRYENVTIRIVKCNGLNCPTKTRWLLTYFLFNLNQWKYLN